VLPEGKKLAVYVGVSVEHHVWGRRALSLAEYSAQLTPDPLNYGWRDYGARVGVFRIMDVLDTHGLRATAPLSSEVIDRNPAIVEEGVARRWCWVGHGVDNSTWMVGLDRDQERAQLVDIADQIEVAVGERPRGWLGPGLTEGPNTSELLAETGYTYNLNWGIDDEPVPMRAGGGRLISVPYSTELNDIPFYSLHGQRAADFADALIDQFEFMLDEGARRPRIMSFGLHPHLSGQAYRAKHLARALEYMTGHGADVWFTTADEIAEWYFASSRE
jgi:peptidoglycan/xylan/chitin deacetylase (PgdA/CDA1 family)